MTFESIKDIRTHIQQVIQQKVGAGQIVNQHWQTTEVLNDYDEISGQDVDFYILTARSWVNAEVKKAIQKYDPQPGEANEQITLDGFEYLQQAYPIKRGDDRCLVPVNQMTYEEHVEKANEYYRMSDGVRKHGDEIMAYANTLKGSAVDSAG